MRSWIMGALAGDHELHNGEEAMLCRKHFIYCTVLLKLKLISSLQTVNLM